MHFSKKSFSHSRSQSSGGFGYRPGGSRFSSSSRGQGGRSFGGRGGRGGGGGRGFKGSIFRDLSKFINKSTPQTDAEVFKPENSFGDFHIEEKLKKSVAAKGYINPTPIQDQAIPHLLRGSDIVGIANTGTGKTATFLVPVINKIIKDPKEKALIMVPTRELAIQIEDEFRALVSGMGIYAVVCVGGAPIYPQISKLNRNPHVVVGTPGRVKDLIERGSLKLGTFQTVVLDEADRMLDMGFINDMKFILGKMPPVRHTLFFSATLSPDIGSLISQFLKDPVTVSVKTRDTSKMIDQDVVRLNPGENKLDRLHTLLNDKALNKVLIFGKTKHGVERLSQDLIKRGFKAESIHGDKNHSRRQRAMGMFKKNEVNILVATDVAARGLDIADVSHVINYDLPATYQDYIHRIGRTGRAGKGGYALTFIE